MLLLVEEMNSFFMFWIQANHIVFGSKDGADSSEMIQFIFDIFNKERGFKNFFELITFHVYSRIRNLRR